MIHFQPSLLKKQREAGRFISNEALKHSYLDTTLFSLAVRIILRTKNFKVQVLGENIKHVASNDSKNLAQLGMALDVLRTEFMEIAQEPCS
jgi:hypothetical protein